MSGLKWRQAKYKLTHDYLSIENVALLVAVVLCLVWTYNSITSMSKNWELSERLNAEKKNLELLDSLGGPMLKLKLHNFGHLM